MLQVYLLVYVAVMVAEAAPARSRPVGSLQTTSLGRHTFHPSATPLQITSHHHSLEPGRWKGVSAATVAGKQASSPSLYQSPSRPLVSEVSKSDKHMPRSVVENYAASEQSGASSTLDIISDNVTPPVTFLKDYMTALKGTENQNSVDKTTLFDREGRENDDSLHSTSDLLDADALVLSNKGPGDQKSLQTANFTNALFTANFGKDPYSPSTPPRGEGLQVPFSLGLTKNGAQTSRPILGDKARTQRKSTKSKYNKKKKLKSSKIKKRRLRNKRKKNRKHLRRVSRSTTTIMPLTTHRLQRHHRNGGITIRLTNNCGFNIAMLADGNVYGASSDSDPNTELIMFRVSQTQVIFQSSIHDNYLSMGDSGRPIAMPELTDAAVFVKDAADSIGRLGWHRIISFRWDYDWVVAITSRGRVMRNRDHRPLISGDKAGACLRDRFMERVV